MWELNHKEGGAPKNLYLQTVVLEKTLESPLDCKEIKPVNPKGNQPWIFTGRTDAETEALTFCLSDVNRQLIGRVPDAGKDWGQKKRVLEDEIAGRHHRCNEYELGQTLADGEGQGGLVCCSPWCWKELDTTGWLNKNKTWNFIYFRTSHWKKSGRVYAWNDWAHRANTWLTGEDDQSLLIQMRCFGSSSQPWFCYESCNGWWSSGKRTCSLGSRLHEPAVATPFLSYSWEHSRLQGVKNYLRNLESSQFCSKKWVIHKWWS